MDVLKNRKKSRLLEGLEILNSRSDLPLDMYRYFLALKLGLEGERRFDHLIEENVSGEVICLNDLLMSINGSTIQIDSLVLTSDMIYLFEVKNFKGSYVLDGDHYRKVDGFEISNPKNQLNKALTLLSQLFRQWKVTTPLKGAVVFINQTFTLYGAMPDDQILFPSQVTSYIEGVNSQQNKMPQNIRSLANRLIEQHKDEAPYQKQLPDYHWSKLKKGLTCGSCKSFNLELTQRSCKCTNCLHISSRKECLLENINDLKLLYSDKKVTTSLVYEWIGGSISKRSIGIMLEATFIKVGTARGRYYR